jgi:hypothetical protein
MNSKVKWKVVRDPILIYLEINEVVACNILNRIELLSG